MSHDCRMIDSWSVLFLQRFISPLYQDPCETLKVLCSNAANWAPVLRPINEETFVCHVLIDVT
jgi:hypothetical protein